MGDPNLRPAGIGRRWLLDRAAGHRSGRAPVTVAAPAKSAMAHQVFISYASADKDVAGRVCGALENAGMACWMAPRNIEPGADFPAAIVAAIQAARVVVLVLTEHAVASPHILTEIGHAFNGRKRIVPFRLSSVALPADLDYFLSMTQWLDAPDGCTDQNLKRLTDAAEEALERQAGSGPLVRRKKPRAVLFASVAAAVLAVGALAYWKWPKPADQPVPAKEASNSASSSPPSARADLPKRKTWLNPQDGQTYVWIPPGSFTMGCSSGDGECRDDEKPAHPVEIEKGFWLAQTEVTNAVYRRFRGSKGHKPEAGDENLPVTNVSWPGAKAYCAAVGGRLPTEAEWEYAARAGKPEIYYGVPLKVAWYEANSDGAPHPVGTKEPNAFGLYDMLGNASEWVLDRYYNKYYVDAAATGAVDQPLAGNATAVARGGYWDADAASLRVSHRSELPNDEPVPTAGIRCASDHIEP